jgi:multidrug efflux pump subunit AcrB
MLTTIAATIGLIPLAVGLNIDFVTLFTEFNPTFSFMITLHLGSLVLTMIFGLLFGTVLTLILVPVMYLLATKLKERIFKRRPKLLLLEKVRSQQLNAICKL